MYHNIPMELRELAQWVCWRYEVQNGRKTKVPYSPTGQYKANVHNPATWGSFNDAVAGALTGTMDGIGMMLTEHDPYTGIDIDDKLENPATDAQRILHKQILEIFPSYTERSVGGRGFHIIIRGKIVGGRDRAHVGVYSTARYLTFSGDVVRNAPIIDCQEALSQLVAAHMPDNGTQDELYEIEGVIDDADLHAMAMNASNGDKYDALCRNDVTYGDTNKGADYTSQSEADLALLSILAYYTRDNEQVRRLFRTSALGQRAKAQGDNRYLNKTLTKIRSSEPTPVDFEAARAAAERLVASATTQQRPPADTPSVAGAIPGGTGATQPVAPSVPSPHPLDAAPMPPPAPAQTIKDLSLPPGLVGELAQYFYSSAVRPVPEMALATAIGLLAGVVGRSYNISATGLNQYILLLAKTGSGKESMSHGISSMISHVRATIAMADDFVGPSSFASGQALVRTLDKKPCFVSLLGEFGLTLQALSDPRAPAATIILRKVLLDLYGKSGWKSTLQSTAYSDSDKNTKMIHAPAVTILGESTPETFYEGINADDIADGLIPRFHVVEYTGPRPARNKNAGGPPSQQLVTHFANVVSLALQMQHNHTCAAVQIAPDALIMLDGFDMECDDQINSAGTSGEAQLWNRAHLKALKLAGVLAVGCNPHAPVVTAAIADWSIDFTRRGTLQLFSRFFAGDIGRGENKQMSDMRRVIKEYFTLPRKSLDAYKVKPEMQKDGAIPYCYMVVRATRLNSFYSDRNGVARALRGVLETLVNMEELRIVPAKQAEERYKTTQAMYYLAQ